MTNSEHKQILAELDAFITKLEKIDAENGKNDPQHPHLDHLIVMLSEAFVYFEYHDGEVDDD
jgi:hypothetical protein